MQITLPPTPPREYFIDWLRMLAIVGVLLFHVAMFFGPWGWHIKNNELVPWLDVPLDIAHRLRMPLLFVIAGAAVSFSLRRRTAYTFLAERARRLLIPVALGMFIIVPPQIYAERVADGVYSGHYWAFLADEVLQFIPYPQGNFSWHHLWFIVYLFVYMLLFTPLFVWWQTSNKRLQPGWWLLWLALPLGINEALLRPYFPERHSLINDWWVLINYALLLWYGFVLSRTEGVWSWLAMQRKIFAGLLLCIVVAILELKAAGIVVGENVWDALSANVFVWVAILTMLAYGKRYLDKDAPSLPWIREFAYPLYILHQTVIILLAWPMMQLPWSIPVKAGLLFFGTVVISMMLFVFLIRPVGLLRVLFGLPYRRYSNRKGTTHEVLAPPAAVV